MPLSVHAIPAGSLFVWPQKARETKNGVVPLSRKILFF
jgi:hypothetical protein